MISSSHVNVIQSIQDNETKTNNIIVPALLGIEPDIGNITKPAKRSILRVPTFREANFKVPVNATSTQYTPYLIYL